MVSRRSAPKIPGMKETARTHVLLQPGAVVGTRTLHGIDGEPIAIPDPRGARIHLQFRRYAGCPICSLHLRSFTARNDELLQVGVREVVVFHSSAAELRQVHRLPFALIADPDKLLYAEFRVGTSPRAVLDPRVWPTAVRAVARGASADPRIGRHSGSFGLPADFLIAPEGRLLAVNYGVHADDQWSVDELLGLAGKAELTPVSARAVG